MSDNSRVFMYLTSPSTGWIKGECTVDEYEEWIELDSWSWELGRKKEEDAATQPTTMKVSKLMDKSSTAMLAAMFKSEELKAKLVVDDGSVDMLFELSIELEKVVIRDYDLQTSVSEKGATVGETWELNYTYITFKHQIDAESGVKIAKLERDPTDNSAGPGGTKRADFKKAGLEMLRATKMSDGDLKELWDELLKAYEDEKKRPSGKPLQHSGTQNDVEDGI